MQRIAASRAFESQVDTNRPPYLAAYWANKRPHLVTWADHFIANDANYTVDPAWLQRVSDVVDYSISNDLYTIVNAHHDS
jgi:hypothetical protein